MQHHCLLNDSETEKQDVPSVTGWRHTQSLTRGSFVAAVCQGCPIPTSKKTCMPVSQHILLGTTTTICPPPPLPPPGAAPMRPPFHTYRMLMATQLKLETECDVVYTLLRLPAENEVQPQMQDAMHDA